MRSLSRTVAASALLGSAAFAGPLNPPAGPIVSTSGPEPRTPINATTTPGDGNSVFRITQPGAYYLAGNVTGVSGRSGIEIASSNVSIDLMGFAVLGVAGALDGITNQGICNNVTIRNGSVNGWPQDGIDMYEGAAVGAGGLIEGVLISGNQLVGLKVTPGGIVKSCSFVANGSDGVQTAAHVVVSDCTARENGANGFTLGSGSTISGSSARLNGSDGIRVGAASVVVACAAYDNSGNGIVGSIAATISGCSAMLNDLHGIVANTGTLVRDCACAQNGIAAGSDGAGISLSGGDSRVEGNLCRDNDVGVRVVGTGNFISRNTCSGNSLNWDVAANNVCYVVDAALSGAISGDAGGVSPGSTNPNANYTY